MIGWSIVALLSATVLWLDVREHGWRRGIVRWIAASAPPMVGYGLGAGSQALVGPAGPWCLVALVVAWLWLRRTAVGSWLTPLALLNFLLLQWFGARLQSSYDDVAAGFDRETKTWRAGVVPGRWWSRHAPPRGVQVSWSLLRWVWPLTGWWSGYRWVARRACRSTARPCRRTCRR